VQYFLYAKEEVNLQILKKNTLLFLFEGLKHYLLILHIANKKE